MYNPRIWYDGDIVTSGGLNNMEQGIAQSAAQIQENTDDIEQLKSGLVTSETVELEHPDSSAHLLLNTSYRRFWEETIPTGAIIDRIEIPIGGVGGGTPWLNIEVWEQINSTTLQKAKTVDVPIVANTTVTVYINYTSQYPCRIAQYGGGNVQYYYMSGATGQRWYLSRESVQSTETILLSSLEEYSNMYLVGNIFYVLLNNKYETQIPLRWRHGTFENGNGNIYASPYPAITDGKISTNVADYIKLKSSRYSARIGYYNADGTYATYQTLAVNSPMQINKQYALFVLSLFIDWNTLVSLDDCNTDIICYANRSVKESAETAMLSFAESSANQRITSVQNKRFNLDFISISHQGFSYTDIPNHNKVDGYALAAARGFDYGETDIKMTSDNVPVCCHDATFVDATSGVTVTISASTYAELQGHDYYGGKLASFDDVCKTCKSNGIGIVIDQATVESVPYVSAILSKYSMWKKSKWMLVYRPEYPNHAKGISDAVIAINPNANFIVDIEFDNEAAIAYAKTLKTATNDVWFHLPYLSYTTNQIAAIMEEDGAGYGMSVYTIDFLGKCKEYMPYVTGIISNQYSTNDILSF